MNSTEETTSQSKDLSSADPVRTPSPSPSPTPTHTPIAQNVGQDMDKDRAKDTITKALDDLAKADISTDKFGVSYFNPIYFF